MDENIKITCPCCDSTLIIRRRDGKLLEVREPLLEESSGDRFEDAFKRVKRRGEVIDGKVADAKRKEEERLKNADNFFKNALDRARNSDDEDEKPFNPLDL